MHARRADRMCKKLNAQNPDQARSQVDEMSKKLLSNPVIESFRFDLIDEDGKLLAG